MKKRLFSLFLSACLLLSMLPAQALALLDGSPLDKRETDQARYQIPGSGTVAEASFEKAWNAIAEAGRGGTVTLTRNVTAKDGSFGSGKGFDAGGRINLPRGEVTIDLAGHTIDRGLAGAAAREGGGVLYVGSGAVLTLTDSKGGGKITGGNTTASGGGAFAAGKLALDGVTISGNKAAVSGGGVYNAGTVSAKGVVTITGNTAGGKENNVFLSAGRTVAVPAGLGNGARIGVTTASAPQPGAPVAAAAGQLTETDTKRFTSDAGLETALVNGKVVLRLASDPVKGSETEPVQAPQNAAAQADGPDIVVTLNPMGGTVSTVSSLKINYPASQENYTGLPASPQKDGYTFGGWYREQDCSGAEVKNGDAITPRSAHTLYASWQAIAQTTAEGDEAEYSKDGTTTDRGSFEEMWSKAATDGGTVKLLQGVTADENGSFGTGTGFGEGGFILVPDDKTITLDLNGHTIDRGLNTARSKGYVIQVGTENALGAIDDRANFTLKDSGDSGSGTITGGYNEGSAAYPGGGILVKVGNFTMEGGKITGNKCRSLKAVSSETDEYKRYKGGGVAFPTSDSKFIMNGGEISDNESFLGGGVYAFTGVKTDITGGKISENKAYQGGGIYSQGTLTISNGEISHNAATNILFIDFNKAYQHYGGGVYSKGTFTLSNGEISSNSAIGGGGVFSSSNFTMTGGSISENITGRGSTASHGGGIWSFPSGGTTFQMSGGTIQENYADVGSGIAFNGTNTDTVILSGGIISNNTATPVNQKLLGVGVSINASINVQISGNLQIYGNTGKVNNVTKPVNLYLPAQPNQRTVTLADALGDDAKIHVTTEDKPTAGANVDVAVGGGTYTPTETDRAKFTSDENYTVELTDDNKIVLAGEKLPTWTVKYDQNDGTGTMDDDTVTVDKDATEAQFTLPPCTFTPPDGKEFDGWAVGSPTAAKNQPGAEITLTQSETTVYALWKAKTYTITFHENNGSGTMNPVTVAAGTEYELPECSFTPPTGKEFDCWAIGSIDGTTKHPSDNITITENTDVYAIWKDKATTPDTFTITLDANGGTIDNGKTQTTITVNKDDTYGSKLIDPDTREGFTFDGWYTAAEGGTKVESSDTPDRNTTLYAHWTEEEEPPTPDAEARYSTTKPTGETVTDEGTFEDMWKLAVGSTTASTVTLLKDITARDGSFGSGEGFGPGGFVLVPTNHAAITLDLNGKTLSRNLDTPQGNGHVIEIEPGTTLTLTDTSTGKDGKLTGGNTTGDGGGILHKGKTFYFEGGKITGNSAQNGGGIWVSGTSGSTMKGGEITGNNAAGNGGGMYHDQGSFRMVGGKITENNAAGNGGGVYHADDQFTVEGDSEISKNTAANGGGIYARSSTWVKPTASIHDNTAAENGGGIYLASGQLDMEGGKITGNTAKLGGGVYHGGEKTDDTPTFRVSGTVEVSGNKGGNVYLTNGMLINNGSTNTSLDDKSVIWVTTEIKPAEGVPVTIATPFLNDEDKSAVFKSDEPHQVQWDDVKKEVQLVVLNKFVVTYDPNGGTLPDDEKFQFYDKSGTETIKDMPEPSREGYTFLGWFTEADGGEKVTEEDNVPVERNMTLYAHWEEIVETFKVTYDANGGSGTMRGHTEVLPDEEITLKPNGFTAPSGMEFNYWAVGSTSGEQKNPGDKITVTKDTTVYAIWKTKSNPSEPSKPSRPSGGGSSGGSSSSDTLTITSSAGTGGSISPKGRVEVKRGSDKTYTITAQSGYVISDVLVDGKSVGARSSYTFEDIRRSHTIKAVFTKQAQQTQQPAHPVVTTPSTTTAGSCPRDASCPIAPFNDAQPTAWYHDGVHACIANGLMTGTGNGRFEPSTPLSRGMLAQILYNREGKPAVGGGSTFPDVPAGAWYENAVKRASATGIVAGYENGSYGPGDAVTREQLVVILWRHAGSPVPINSTPFSDFNDTREYARDAVRWAYGSSIISGKEGNRFDPSGRASRAEVAQMLKNYFML
ncbi:hypothetical protein D7X33_05775 [Butyricicoccus sp. 1XD8-22]|nr:hypothetical protein D7X33_05775 [Butyricicoccus sp. 1XD8-22]